MLPFEAPFQASALSDSKNQALQASSLMALPPPPPGAASLVGLTALNLPGFSLTQWAACVQDVAIFTWLQPIRRLGLGHVTPQHLVNSNGGQHAKCNNFREHFPMVPGYGGE